MKNIFYKTSKSLKRYSKYSKSIKYSVGLVLSFLMVGNLNQASDNIIDLDEPSVLYPTNTGKDLKQEKRKKLLNKKNRELKDLYLQNDFIIKPEYLEWQVLLNSFYTNSSRGKRNNIINQEINRDPKSINLGVALPIKSVAEKNINLNITSVTEPKVQFNTISILAPNIGVIDFDYDKQYLPEISYIFVDLIFSTNLGGVFSVGTKSNNVGYSTSGLFMFENLNVEALGGSGVILDFGNTGVVNVNGQMDYFNASAGVSGTTSAIPYQHTGLNYETIHTISKDGDYEIKGKWTANLVAFSRAFLNYESYYVTSDSKVTILDSLDLNKSTGTGSLIGIQLKLESQIPNNPAKITFENKGTITLNGGSTAYGIFLKETYNDGNYLEADIINSGEIVINSIRNSPSFAPTGSAILIELGDKATGKINIKPGKIIINGKRNSGISLVSPIGGIRTDVDSNILIDGTDGLIEVGGTDGSVGIQMARNNGKINSNNATGNIINLNLILSGEESIGILRQTESVSEHAKDMIIDSSLIQSIKFDPSSEKSVFFKSQGGNLTIDSSMTNIFGVINDGALGTIVTANRTPEINGDILWKPKIVNNADITIGSNAKAMKVIYAYNSDAENTGDIRNDSGSYVSGSTTYGSVSLLARAKGATLTNTGNIVVNGDFSRAIYNEHGTVTSINDHIILTGDAAAVLHGVGVLEYSSGVGVWTPNESYITTNKIELMGKGSSVFMVEGSNFTLTPATLGGTMEIIADGEDAYGIYDSPAQRGLSNFKINGNINMNIKNGGIAFFNMGSFASSPVMNAAEYVNNMIDTTNGSLNINVDENSYRTSFYGSPVSIAGLSALSDLGSTGITFTGENKNIVVFGTLHIDKDSNIDENNSMGDKTYRDVVTDLIETIVYPNITISGTEDSLLGVASLAYHLGGTVYYENGITNNGIVSLTGSNSVGIFGKRSPITNAGYIKMTGEKGIGIVGKASVVNNIGSIIIGNEGVGIYSETYIAPIDNPNTRPVSLVENSGSIVSEVGENTVGIYTVKNAALGVTDTNELKLYSGTNIDMSKSKRGVGIYSNKSDITGTGKITVGENGYGIYVKDANVNLTNLELNLLGDNAVGIYTDGTGSFNGTGTINVDGKGIVIFNVLSSGAFNQNFQISAAAGSTYVFQNVKDKEIFSDSTITLGEGGMLVYGVNSSILFGTNSNMNSYNNISGIYDSNIIGVTLSGGNSTGLPVIINGETLQQEATNKGIMSFGNGSAGMYVTDGASALNEGVISLGKTSVGIYGKGTNTRVSNIGSVLMGDESIGLFLNNGLDMLNTGTIESTGDKTVGIYSDTSNTSNINHTNVIRLTGNGTVGVYLTGTGNQTFQNTGNIIAGFSTDVLNPSIGIYNNTSSGIVLNNGLVSVRENSIGIYNKDGAVSQITGNIETGENSIGIYSSSGSVKLDGGIIKLMGTNGTGIYGINNAKIENNVEINMVDGNYGIVLQSGAELINSKNQTFANDGVFVYSDNASKVVNNVGADIVMNGSRNVAFYMVNGGELINNASIVGNLSDSNIGIYNKEGSVVNTGDIKLGDSVIIDPENPYANSYSVAIYSENTLSTRNSGNIEIGKSGVGVYTRKGNSETINTGDIKSSSESAIGIFADNGSVRNEGNIILSGKESTGIAGERSAVITNSGTITMNGENSIGIYAHANSKVINTVSGIININGNNSTGIQLLDGSTLENFGQIILASGIIGSQDIINGGSSFTPPSIINAGVIKVDEKFDLNGLILTIKVDPTTVRVPTLEEITLGGYDFEDINAGFLMSNKVTIKAPSFDFGGNTVKIDPTFTQKTNARVYKFENVFDPSTPEGGQNTGLISLKSLSLSFDAIPVINGTTGGVDVWMEKINYSEFIQGTVYDDFAKNIETKYLGATGNALKIYDKLDLITDVEDLRYNLGQLTGDVYANINKREQDISEAFNSTLDLLQSSRNNTKENVKIGVIAGKGSTEERTNGVKNYDYITAGVFALREVERSYKHKIGYSFAYTKTEFDFGGINSKDKVNSYQIGVHNKYSIGEWNIKNDLVGRVSTHDLERTIKWSDGEESELSSDFNSYNIALRNEINKELSIGENLKVIPYGGLELGYTTHSSFEEKGLESLRVDSNDGYSIKPSVGIKLEGEKNIGTIENLKLKGSVGIGYEYELGKMNKQERANLKEIEEDYHKLAKVKKDKGRFKTGGSIGLELKEIYTISLLGEYKVGKGNQEDYRIGVNFKVSF